MVPRSNELERLSQEPSIALRLVLRAAGHGACDVVKHPVVVKQRGPIAGLEGV